MFLSAAIGHGIDEGLDPQGLITLHVEHPAGARVCDLNVLEELRQSRRPAVRYRSSNGKASSQREPLGQRPLADQITQLFAVSADGDCSRALSLQAALQDSLQEWFTPTSVNNFPGNRLDSSRAGDLRDQRGGLAHGQFNRRWLVVMAFTEFVIADLVSNLAEASWLGCRRCAGL